MFVMFVPELVASGGALVATPLEHTGRGYLSPADWRDALLAPDDGRTVVIDVRNRNETALGRFGRALDPNTRSFAEFPTWVEAHAETLRGKRVLLYCTGGVRCEKASAWVRASGVASEVRHLQGGIHKYLEAFGEDGAEEGAPARADGAAALWRGKNFVFDRRGALGAADDASAPSRVVVGRCVGCAVPWELLDGLVACAVCNEPLLACDACRATPAAAELCCAEHAHLRGAYCRGLAGYPDGALADQILKLEAIAAGLARGARGQRRTLGAQAERVRAELAARREGRSDGGARTRPADAQAPVAEAAETRCLVAGEFPASTAAARRAWPCRIWPLSARPWAFIRDTPPPEGAPADARFCVEVDCKVAAVGPAEEGGAGARLAPQGEPARTRVRRVRWDAASGASELAVCLTLPLGPTSAECALQTRLHLAWLGFEMLGDANK
jgi:predicted sulfurtransferase